MPDTHAVLESLVAAAVKAPSGDNVQPWRFILNARERVISVRLDVTRDTSLINAGQRMSMLACGAALENLIRAARRMGFTVIQEIPDEGDLARILVYRDTNAVIVNDHDEVLKRRCTNRRFYDGRAVPRPVLSALRVACPDDQGVKTHFLTDAEGRATCAKADARATSLMYLQHGIRRAIGANIRFDTPGREVPDDGLSKASLEISAIERFALRMLFKSPNWLLRFGGGLKAMEWHFRRLHRSASGLCLVTASNNRQKTDVIVGRAMQRAWLALTEQGLAVQPMMSVAVLDGIRTMGEPTLVSAIGSERIKAFLDQIKSAFDVPNHERPAVLLRFGYAPPPTGRSGRRALSEVMFKVAAQNHLVGGREPALQGRE